MKTARLPKLTAAQSAIYAKAAARAADAAWMAAAHGDAQTAMNAALCASNIADVLTQRLQGEMPVNAQITPDVAVLDADYWYARMREVKAANEAKAAEAARLAALEICYQ